MGNCKGPNISGRQKNISGGGGWVGQLGREARENSNLSQYIFADGSERRDKDRRGAWQTNGAQRKDRRTEERAWNLLA